MSREVAIIYNIIYKATPGKSAFTKGVHHVIVIAMTPSGVMLYIHKVYKKVPSLLSRILSTTRTKKILGFYTFPCR